MGACGGVRRAGAVIASLEKQNRPISTTPNERRIITTRTLMLPPRSAKPTPAANLHLQTEKDMSRASSNSGQCKRKWSRQGNSADRCNGAADFSEVLEHDAGPHRYPGSDITATDTRLGDRTDKRHTLVLIDSRHRGIEAGARCRRGRRAINQGRAVG